MSIPLMHDFETKVGTVQNVSPGIDGVTLSRIDRLVKVKSIQVESHSRNT